MNTSCEKRVGSCSRHVWIRAPPLPMTATLRSIPTSIFQHHKFKEAQDNLLRGIPSVECASWQIGQARTHHAWGCSKVHETQWWEILLLRITTLRFPSCWFDGTYGDDWWCQMRSHSDTDRPDTARVLVVKKKRALFKSPDSFLKRPNKAKNETHRTKSDAKSWASSASDEVRCRSRETKEERKRQCSKIDAPLDTLSGETCAAHS